MKPLLWCALLFVFCECSALPPTTPSLPTRIYRGVCTKRWEVSRFQPCGSREEWWITGHVDRIITALTTPDGFTGGTLYVEVQGSVSSPGRYGHLGAYRRELTVHKVLVAKAPGPEDCR
jgi:hypothetical protein